MKHYQFSNIEITDQFISANVYKDNNYIMKIGAEILHLEHTQDIIDVLYQEFREFALDYLYHNDFIEDVSANIINTSQHNKRCKNVFTAFP